MAKFDHETPLGKLEIGFAKIEHAQIKLHDFEFEGRPLHCLYVEFHLLKKTIWRKGYVDLAIDREHHLSDQALEDRLVVIVRDLFLQWWAVNADRAKRAVLLSERKWLLSNIECVRNALAKNRAALDNIGLRPTSLSVQDPATTNETPWRPRPHQSGYFSPMTQFRHKTPLGCLDMRFRDARLAHIFLNNFIFEGQAYRRFNVGLERIEETWYTYTMIGLEDGQGHYLTDGVVAKRLAKVIVDLFLQWWPEAAAKVRRKALNKAREQLQGRLDTYQAALDNLDRQIAALPEPIGDADVVDDVVTQLLELA